MRNLKLITVAATFLLAGCESETPMQSPDAESALLMYVGTYTRETSAGIYAYRFDPSSGQAEALGLAAEARNPSFLALHPNGDFLYSVTETDDFGESGGGSVTAFAIDPASGMLRKLNEVSSRGPGPCHLSVDPSGSMLIVANYRGGSIASFPVHSDGSLGEAASAHQHEGSSVHPRQEEPHAHSADFTSDSRFAFFSDLGLDQVKIYRASAESATLTPHDPPHVSVEPGSGPRHLALHPGERFAYGINELASTVTTYALDLDAGTLAPVQTVSTLPADHEAESYTAEIAVHPSGRFVYGSNRGHNSIAMFAVDPQTGELQAGPRTPTEGDWPRFFGIDPAGNYLLAANQRTDNIVIFRIDQETGALEATGMSLAIDAPVCIVFREIAE